VYGDGQQIRDWLYVEDHCRGLRRVLEAGRPGEAYNIGGHCQRSNLQVVEAICAMATAKNPDTQHPTIQPMPAPAPPTDPVAWAKELMPPDRMQMIENEIAKFENPLIRRASS